MKSISGAGQSLANNRLFAVAARSFATHAAKWRIIKAHVGFTLPWPLCSGLASGRSKPGAPLCSGSLRLNLPLGGPPSLVAERAAKGSRRPIDHNPRQQFRRRRRCRCRRRRRFWQDASMDDTLAFRKSSTQRCSSSWLPHRRVPCRALKVRARPEAGR